MMGTLNATKTGTLETQMSKEGDQRGKDLKTTSLNAGFVIRQYCMAIARDMKTTA